MSEEKKEEKNQEKAPKVKDQGEKAAKTAAGKAARAAKSSEKSSQPAEKKAKPKKDPNYKPRLRTLYKQTVAAALKEEFAYKSSMQIPRMTKIVVSMGVGVATENKKLLDNAVAELTQIVGMKVVKTQAKKSIAQFKIRKGQEIGCMATLRGDHMYEFFDRLVNIAMPRIKDFRGVNPNAFDGHGNYALGITEQIIFPEIDFDKIERVAGLNVAIVTTARTDQEARSLLAKMGMPFRK